MKDCLNIKVNEKVIFTATPRQTEFLLSLAKYPLFGGAMRGGKSYALCAGALLQSLKYPGNRGYIARKTFADFKKTTMMTLFNVIPNDLIKSHNKSDKVITLVNGSIIEYGDLEDWNKLRSLEVGWGAIDEASELDDTLFNIFATRVGWWKLPDKSVPEQKIYLASNPGAGFLYNRWVKAYEGIADFNPDFVFYPALPKDNPYITQDFIENLYKVLPQNLAQRYLDGSWHVVLEDNPVYGNDFNPSIHATNVLKPNPHLPIYLGFDFGLTPACVFCQYIFGRLFIFRELVTLTSMGIERFTETRVIPTIKEFFPNYEIKSFCDPAGFVASQVDERTCVDVLNRNGIYPMAGEVHTEKRRMSVSKFLNTNIDGSPALLIDKANCPMLFQGFLGEFKYNKTTGSNDSPGFEKNEFSHVHEAVQYVTSGLEKSGVSEQIDFEKLIAERPAYLDKYIISNTI